MEEFFVFNRCLAILVLDFCTENNGPVKGNDLASKHRDFKPGLLLGLGEGMKGRCTLQAAKRKQTLYLVWPLFSFLCGQWLAPLSTVEH